MSAELKQGAVIRAEREHTRMVSAEQEHGAGAPAEREHTRVVTVGEAANGRGRLDPRPADPEIVFVGGTGRSGTHVVSQLLAEHSRYARVPIEARFHVNPSGFPDLLAGRVGVDEFLRKLRRFWWRRIRAGELAPVVLRRLALGRKVRGLHKVVPRERFDAAVEAFEAAYEGDPAAACRGLFLDLLWPLASAAGKPGLVEMSCFTVAEAPTLLRLFPEARIVHAVRDGRDAGASKAAKRQKRSHPSDVEEGLRWWEERLRRIEAGVREVPADRVHVIGLDELVGGDREAAYAGLLEFLALGDERRMRELFERDIDTEAAHAGRWREGLDETEQRQLTGEYERTLARLEADGFHCAPTLRRALERQSVPGR